jgi:probable DNA repair protein
VEPAAWTRFWSHLIKASGWPGDLEFSSAESEAVDQWLDLLSAFDSLGLTGCRFNAPEALSHLHSVALESNPPKGDLSTPIHVLEPEQAMPLRFDGAWLVGASELKWPPAFFAPAYLPAALLRGQCVPAATPQGRRERARLLSNYIETCAPSVIASFSAGDAPGTRLSALFQPLQEADRERLHLWKGQILLGQLKSQQLEQVEDTYGPKLTPGTVVSGGARLLKSQSDCPFQAFARWRLRAEPLEDGEFSYDARQRGLFLHQALDVVWAELRDSEKLRSLTSPELETIVSRAVTKALSSDSSETDFRAQLRGAEQNRLVPLILEWLELEKRRPGSFKIREAETTREFTLPRFSLRLRADRIDELDGGGLVIIDYKSGEKKRADLDSARPREPQLLAYAAMLASEAAPESRVEGLYFATLRRDACAAEGYGRSRYFNEAGEAADWDLRLKEWQTTIRGLAEEFENGRAHRATSSKPCDFCEMKSICRIEETRREADLEDFE